MIGDWAFWKYDCFPYYQGGEIVRYLENGDVETRQYGGGYSFTPRAILPPEEGRKAYDAIDQLRAEYNRDMKLVEELHKAKAVEAVPFLSAFKFYGGHI